MRRKYCSAPKNVSVLTGPSPARCLFTALQVTGAEVLNAVTMKAEEYSTARWQAAVGEAPDPGGSAGARGMARAHVGARGGFRKDAGAQRLGKFE